MHWIDSLPLSTRARRILVVFYTNEYERVTGKKPEEGWWDSAVHVPDRLQVAEDIANGILARNRFYGYGFGTEREICRKLGIPVPHACRYVVFRAVGNRKSWLGFATKKDALNMVDWCEARPEFTTYGIAKVLSHKSRP